MSFFSGEYDCKLDAKGRLVLPSRIKNALPKESNKELIIRKGYEKCIVLYPIQEYKKIYKKIASLSEFNKENRTIQRNFFRGTSTLEMDNVGRLLIPKQILDYAQLDRQAIVVGVGERVEIWNPELYHKDIINDPDELSNMVQKFLD